MLSIEEKSKFLLDIAIEAVTLKSLKLIFEIYIVNQGINQSYKSNMATPRTGGAGISRAI